MAGGNQETDHREGAADRDSTDQATEADSAGEAGTAGLDCVDEPADDDHLEELPDGSGCVEIWEHLADRRGED